ncbi:MAG: radical SAM protein [Nanoarchaeota archaeon]
MDALLTRLSEDIRYFLQRTYSGISLTGIKKEYMNVLFSFSSAQKDFTIFLKPSYDKPHYAETELFGISLPKDDSLLLLATPIVDLIVKRLSTYESKMTEEQKKIVRKYFPPEDEFRRMQDASSSAVFFTTPNCNIHCAFCKPIAMRNMNDIPPLETVKRTLSTLREKYDAINFEGGEPTTYPYLPEAIAYARKLGFKSISIVTNGINLSDQRYLYQLLDAGLQTINMSFHSVDPKVSNETHGRDITAYQDRALRNIETLRTRIVLTLQSVLTRFNHHSVKELFDYLVSWNPDNIICIYGIQPFGVDDSILGNLDMIDIGRHYAALRENFVGNIFLRAFPPCRIPKELRPNLQKRGTDIGFPEDTFFPSKKEQSEKASVCISCLYLRTCRLNSKLYLLQYPDQTLTPIHNKE